MLHIIQHCKLHTNYEIRNMTIYPAKLAIAYEMVATVTVFIAYIIFCSL